MNYNEIEKTSAIPAPASMMETLRAIGYSLETAIADIIDNSISANARNIYIDSVWKGGESVITIFDDGCGMSQDELIEAMRPGTKHPFAKRDEKDLGRFGLGLKTSSFSQCRMLTVFSKKKGYVPVYWTWDLDYVNISHTWDLLKYIPEEYASFFDDKESGTLIIWNKLDRVLPSETLISDNRALGKFTQVMEQVKHHVSMTFHRFIEDKQIKLYCWNKLISPWNPFLINEPATQSFPEDHILGGATMKGFILPHKSKISENIYKHAEGLKGWNAQQGFYVYRGKRLLLAGEWFELFRKEEHYKLARIMIELPVKLDSEWQIDIKKSSARPPMVCKDQLRSYALKVRGQACEAYRHRGRIIRQKSGQSFQSLWLDKKKGDKWSFVINREHSLIKEFKELAYNEPEKAIEQMLRFIEETIPVKSIFIKESENGENQTKPFEDSNYDMIKFMRKIYDNQIKNGKTPEQVRAFLLNLEAFNNFPEIITSIE